MPLRCRRADEIDPEDFLMDAAGEAFADFRAHYVNCEYCSAIVAGWSAFDVALREAAAETLTRDATDGGSAAALPWVDHPTPETLEAFVISPSELGNTRMLVEAHLNQCVLCRGEVNLLRQFDPTQFEVFAVSNAATTAVEIPEIVEEEGFFDRVRGWLSAPAFGRAAVPVLGILIAIGVYTQIRNRAVETGAGLAPVEIAQENSTPVQPEPEPTPDLTPVVTAIDPEPERLAEVQPEPVREQIVEPPAPSAAPEPVIAPEITEPPAQLAEADVTPSPSPSPAPTPTPTPTPAPAPAPAPAAPVEREEILLAALTDLPLPTYQRPSSSPNLGWMGQFGPVRSAGQSVKIESLAPSDHTGLTLSNSPRLWWHTAEATDHAFQVTVVDDTAIEPLLRVDLPGPHTAGVHQIDLSEHGVTLPADRDFRWFVSVVIDPNRPSRNPVAAGSVRVLAEGDARRSEIVSISATNEGHRLAELGIWYDAYDFFADLVKTHPDQSALRAYRDGLADQVRANE